MRSRLVSLWQAAIATRRRCLLVAGCTLLLALAALDALLPPPLARANDLAFVLLDRHGEPLRYRLARDGRLRLPTTLDEVDPKLPALLLAYEDKRFHWHPGVDPLALGRALWQAARHGRVVSGASTLTMQTARLLEPRARTPLAKIIEMLRAAQLELHYSKQEILALYLTLAPYGGNVEGVQAASRLWFGKSATRLTPGEAALLVALPQSPSRLRPDRHPKAARAARARVLARVGDRLSSELGWNDQALTLARNEPIALAPPRLPFIAPHLTDRLDRGAASARACITSDLQQRIETLARGALPAFNPHASVAVLVVENRSAEVHAYVGNADYFAQARGGQVDVIPATRSPGSTLKPFLYGLAFDLDLARPATLTLDAPTRFGNYAPGNFEGEFLGTVSLIEALRRSLNVPAVTLLDAIGPVRFAGALAAQGTPLRLPDGVERPGLAIALGGAGSSLEHLTRLYRGLADDGVARPLRLRCDHIAPVADNGVAAALLRSPTRWHLRQILRHAPAPSDRIDARTLGQVARIAQKTGTSYGFRDAWAFGYDNRFTVGVWVGRPDGTPHPGRYGHNTAAPLLYRVFDELPGGGTEPQPPVDAALAWDNHALPARLRTLGRGAQRGDGPRLLFPLPDAVVLADQEPLQFSAEGGTPPYTWLIDGEPIATTPYGRAQWLPSGAGFVVATVVDAGGAHDRVAFRIANGTAGAHSTHGDYGAPVGYLRTLR